MDNIIKTFEELVLIPSITNTKAEIDIVNFTEEKLKSIVLTNKNLS
jgi:hypothetical protein